MLCSRVLNASRAQYTHRASATLPKTVPVLHDASLATFRRDALEAAAPASLPQGHFADMPAIQKWFVRTGKEGGISLNTTYLAQFGSAMVPLEMSNNHHFTRTEQPFAFFLDASHAALPTAQIYLAQAALADLPRALAGDVPTPDLVLKAGNGDVYHSSIWLGRAPTYTPLHRDPNPNLFVQLAGDKVVRLFGPTVGRSIFAHVQEVIGGSASATMRGEEMMVGKERKALEDEVWQENGPHDSACHEVILQAGDALFIPKGWWHSIKGVGNGMTGSVNWWFR